MILSALKILATFLVLAAAGLIVRDCFRLGEHFNDKDDGDE